MKHLNNKQLLLNYKFFIWNIILYIFVNSYIYCNKDFLQAIQESKVFGSSKTFVDKKRRKKELDIFTDFIVLKYTTFYNRTIPLPELQKFVKTNFQTHSIRKWSPPDFKNHPLIIDYVQDYTYKWVYVLI